MALFNPVYAFFVPFLFVVTIPLAVFAGLTTLFAFSVLIFRVAIVYLDIAISLVPQSIVGFKPRRYRPPRQRLQLQQQPGRFLAPRQSPSAISLQSATPSPTLTPGRRRRRRPSSASVVSNGSTTPIGEGSLGLFPSLGPERDFEGVGGWRVGDDDIWTTINSRLELPDRRHHHRTASGGTVTTPGDGSYLMMKGRNRSPEARIKSAMSPNSSRARTPTGSRISFANGGHNDGYFPLTLSPKAVKKQSSVTGD